MLVKNIKRKHGAFEGSNALDTSLRDYLLEHAYSNAEQPLAVLGVADDLYDQMHMFIWAIRVRETRPDSVSIVTSLSLAECSDMAGMINLFQGRIHILWPIQSMPAPDTDDVPLSSRASTSLSSGRVLTSFSSTSSLKREAKSPKPLSRKRSKLSLLADPEEEINWPDVQPKEEYDTDSLPSLSDLIPERKMFKKKEPKVKVEIKIEPGLQAEVKEEILEDNMEEIKQEILEESYDGTQQDTHFGIAHPAEDTFQQLFEDLVATDLKQTTPITPDEVDRLSEHVKVSI